MIVVGGQAPKAIRSVECYDFEEDRWDQIAELPSRRCRAGESHGLPMCQLPPNPHSHAAGLCRVLKFCSLFLKTLCIPHSLPFPSPPAHFLAVPSGVSSYCLGTSGYCKYLLNTNKISNANLRGNPMSPIVTSKYHKLEITFSVKLSVFICLPHSHTVTFQNVSHQLFEMTLMPWFPMPQVWCSWLAMCMLWAGSMAHCVCGQWTCMMGWRTSGRPSPACRSAGARWVQLCSMTCSMPWGALMAVLVGPGLSHHPAWDMHSMLLWFEASQVARQ